MGSRLEPLSDIFVDLNWFKLFKWEDQTKIPTQPNRCYGWSLLPHLSSVVRFPQMSLVLGVSVPPPPLNQTWLLNHLANNNTVNPIQLKHQINCDVLSFCFLGLDNRFRSSCLHRWVLSSPWAPFIVLLRCAEWWPPTLCGRWDITPHGRLSCLISVSHSLHAPPLCLPLTGGYASVCTVPVQFHSPLILYCWWCSYARAVLFVFLKDTPCNIKSFVWLCCDTKPNKADK